MNQQENTRPGSRGTIAFAMCGSFCTFEAAVPQVARLVSAGWKVLPVMSFSAAGLDTRFGRAADWKEKLEEITGQPVRASLTAVEPLGPKGLAQGLVIAPCTGTTLARLAAGLSDTPVTLAAKSLLRVGCPVVIAVSTNDGLAASARNIGALLDKKNVYFVPFRQDDPAKKPTSLVADFSQVEDTIDAALAGRQLQPVLLGSQ